MAKNKNYSSQFKSKVALEALKGDKTIVEIAQKYSVHPNQVGQWRKQLIENSSSAFDKANKKDHEKERQDKKIDQLHKTIGQLSVERDFLKKKYKELYGMEPDL